jgi:hypothetical protein
MKGKELMIIEPVQLKPQYGGRTLVQKVTGYKTSDGDILENKDTALKLQSRLDKEERVELFIKKHLKVYKTGHVNDLPYKVVSLWHVRNLLSRIDDVKREID